jgi:Superinfection immunity protein
MCPAETAAGLLTGIIGAVFIAMLFAGGLIVYFIPTIAALVTKHPHKIPIFLLNFFAGWTLLGWVGGLVWAFVKQQSSVQVVHHYNVPPPLPSQSPQTVLDSQEDSKGLHSR